MKIWAALAALCSSACVLAGDDEPEQGSTDEGSTDGGEGEASADSEIDDSSDAADETGAISCAPDPTMSCADVGAPSLRGLSNGEWFGLSTRDGITDLVLDETQIRRRAPQPEHVGYPLVFWPGHEGEIQAGLSPETRGELTTLIHAAPASVGAHGYGREATLRLDDRQVCIARDMSCDGFESLVDYAVDLDNALLDAWRAQDSGTLHALAEVVIEPWPLTIAWGEGGDFEISEDEWESFEGSWFSDVQDRTAHVDRRCYGGDDGCNTWIITVALVGVATSELRGDQHRKLLEGVEFGSFGAVLQVEGADFIGVRDTQLLTFEDPDDPAVVHTLAVVARPSLVVDTLL
ncbi:MAG: hypothetical protein JKY37_32790 [Nannocystaceae bacterium]|nr:hypothetical protein [Nannocystaceae bacterium]